MLEMWILNVSAFVCRSPTPPDTNPHTLSPAVDGWHKEFVLKIIRVLKVIWDQYVVSLNHFAYWVNKSGTSEKKTAISKESVMRKCVSTKAAFHIGVHFTFHNLFYKFVRSHFAHIGRVVFGMCSPSDGRNWFEKLVTWPFWRGGSSRYHLIDGA